MTLLSFGDVGVEFAGASILQSVTFTVTRGERWGIVGRNGAGKTTLFRLMTGSLAPSRGTVARAPGLRILLLDQHRDFGDAETLWEAAAQGYAEVIALEQALAHAAERLSALGDRVTERDLEDFGRDQERFAHLGGYDYEARVNAVLQGLGFDAAEARERRLATLSGGERGRIGLAAPLAAPADLLLLDEPTNHLDLETITWLTGWLRDQGTTTMVISHDRAFLDEVADHILHVHAGTTRDYRGGYSAFVTQRAERELTARRAFERQQQMVAREEDYIRRNIAGQNSAQAKGRRKRLARLPRLSPPPGEAGAMSIVLEATDRGGDRVAEVQDLTVAVGHRVLFAGVSLTAMRGDVIALVGPNGAGKSTLLATLLGARAPDEGDARVGASITPAWYRQDLAGVPLGRSIYDVIADLRPAWTRGQIQGHLGAFGFSGDEVQRSTTTLSGGERARVALAMITLARANLLVLDEPTNHLDVESIEVLEDAIEGYEGTVILVSHDRAFLRELATRVWAIHDGTVEDFAGPFVEWETRRAERDHQRRAEATRATQARRAAERSAAARARTATARTVAERRDHERALARAEARAAAAEARVVELEQSLAQSSLYQDEGGAQRAAELARLLDEARRELDAAVAGWAELADDSG